ncbi:MAG: hypothetical protein JNL45_08430 [Hyphomicrobium sp.]|nr:hypothetical protein [Hyphomicrobium sp.]
MDRFTEPYFGTLTQAPAMPVRRPRMALPDVCQLGPIRIAADQMVAFARRFDPQPFHVDEQAARGTLLGGLAASAWYTCTKLMGEIARFAIRHSVVLDLAGAEQIILLGPVRGNDRLTITLFLSDETLCTCGDPVRRGRVEAVNQMGEVVMRLMLDCVLNPRASGLKAADVSCPLRQGRAARGARAARPDAIRYFEDVVIGSEIDLGHYTFGPEAVAEFNACTGNAAQHVDGSTEIGSCDVPIWHLPAAWMQRMVRFYEEESKQREASGEPIPRLGPATGFKQLRWHRPVAIGETITFRGWAERKLDIASQHRWGLLVVGAEGLNADGETVVSFYPQMLLERRNP